NKDDDDNNDLFIKKLKWFKQIKEIKNQSSIVVNGELLSYILNNVIKHTLPVQWSNEYISIFDYICKTRSSSSSSSSISTKRKKTALSSLLLNDGEIGDDTKTSKCMGIKRKKHTTEKNYLNYIDKASCIC